MSDTFPHAELIKKLGYSLHSYAGNRKSATYINENGICLTVYEKNNQECEAVLSSMYKMITLTSGTMSFPNKNFHIFENQITYILQSCEPPEEQVVEEETVYCIGYRENAMIAGPDPCLDNMLNYIPYEDETQESLFIYSFPSGMPIYRWRARLQKWVICGGKHD